MLLMFDGEEPSWVPTMKLVSSRHSKLALAYGPASHHFVIACQDLLNGIERKEPAINNDIMIDIGCSYIHRIDNPT